MNRIKSAVISLAIVVISASSTLAVMISKGVIHNPLSPATTLLVDQSTLDGLPKKNGSAANISRIADNIIPPTNSWLSGMVLQATPLPVYPMPLSFLAKDSGFEVGLPTVQSSPTVILGEHTPGIIANINDATGFKLSRYDKISATLNYYAKDKLLGNLTLAEGSPYVFFRSTDTTSLSLTGISTVNQGASSSYMRYTKSGHDYIITTSQGANITLHGSTATISAPKNSLVTFYALPNSTNDTLRSLAGNSLESVYVTNQIDKSQSTTTFEYKTINNQPTIFVPMSYSQIIGSNPIVATYNSIYGPMNAIQGTRFTTSVPTIHASNKLDLSGLSEAHKQQLIATLQPDIAKTTITATDSYFAGKQLARAATLLDISEQLGQTDSSNRLKSILRDGFAKRLDSNYFYYDTILRGVSAQTKAFGSEDFNDHHFHYGYFIYAASILGRYDTDFLKNNSKQVNLLVADIANYAPTNSFPLERNYDPYVSHSWAAGLSPFADGNNQESSSEAINAWNGVEQWAELTNNTQLQESASWMLSNEAATAKSAWRTVNTTAADYLNGFKSPLTSLNFGGKRTYSTFFSDEPSAKLGIQLIPMNPGMLSFAADGSAIASVVQATIKGDNYNVALGDYILMYLALHDPAKAAQLIGKQQDNFIDDGNSRTYMDAWVFSLTDK